jgi:hypothetical protein
MIANRVQEQAFGTLDRATLNLLDGLARRRSARRSDRNLKIGTVLVRDYHGRRQWLGPTPMSGRAPPIRACRRSRGPLPARFGTAHAFSPSHPPQVRPRTATVHALRRNRPSLRRVRPRLSRSRRHAGSDHPASDAHPKGAEVLFGGGLYQNQLKIGRRGFDGRCPRRWFWRSAFRINFFFQCNRALLRCDSRAPEGDRSRGRSRTKCGVSP